MTAGSTVAESNFNVNESGFWYGIPARAPPTRAIAAVTLLQPLRLVLQTARPNASLRRLGHLRAFGSE